MAMVNKSNPHRQSARPVSHSTHPSHQHDDGIHLDPSHKGLLHQKLHVPQGQKIPASKLAAALHSSSPAERKEANFARNFGK